MKKYIYVIIILTVVVVVSILYAYRLYNKEIQDLKDYNYSFEQFNNKEIEGTQIATILNKAVNNNEENNIKKDENNNYIENNENSIKIDIHIKDNDTIYSMETIYNMGVEKFINSFSLETFKIEKIQYHETTKKIKYILINQQ